MSWRTLALAATWIGRRRERSPRAGVSAPRNVAYSAAAFVLGSIALIWLTP